MSVKRRYVFGMLSGAGSVVLKTLLNILVIPVMILHLGLDVFGLHILLVAMLEISMLMDFGATPALVTRLGAEAPESEKRRSYLKVGHCLFGLLGVAFLIGGLLLAPRFPHIFHIAPEMAGMAQFAFTLTAVECAVAIYSCYYRSILLAHCTHQWTNLADSIYAIVANLGALVLLMMGYHLPAILVVRLAGSLLRIALMMLQSLKVEPYALRPQVPLDRQAGREVAQLGFHAMMINFSVIISHKIDDIVIARFLPLSAVAIYEIVFRFLGIIIQICLKLHEGAYSLYSRMAAGAKQADAQHALAHRADARQMFLRMSCFLCFVTGMLSMLIVSYYPQLFHIFSAGRMPIEETFPVLLVAVPCVLSGVLQMPASAWLFTWGHQKFVTVTSIVAALSNLVLSIVLVKITGNIVGVAIGTLIPQLIQHQAGLIRKTCQELRISFREYIGTVYGGVLLPLAVSALWVQLWKPLTLMGPWKLVPMGLSAATALLIGGSLWFWRTASDVEREIFMVKLLEPVLLKLKRKPVPHEFPTGDLPNG